MKRVKLFGFYYDAQQDSEGKWFVWFSQEMLDDLQKYFFCNINMTRGRYYLEENNIK
jgi:hypothetical protein